MNFMKVRKADPGGQKSKGGSKKQGGGQRNKVEGQKNKVGGQKNKVKGSKKNKAGGQKKQGAQIKAIRSDDSDVSRKSFVLTSSILRFGRKSCTKCVFERLRERANFCVLQREPCLRRWMGKLCRAACAKLSRHDRITPDRPPVGTDGSGVVFRT